MRTIKNARIVAGLVPHQEDGPYTVEGCLFTPERATKKQLAQWYWLRLRRWAWRNST